MKFLFPANLCFSKMTGNCDVFEIYRKSLSRNAKIYFVFLSQGNSLSEGEEYFATQLGSATLGSSLSPDEALIVFSELQRARQSFVLESELHMIYQVMTQKYCFWYFVNKSMKGFYYLMFNSILTLWIMSNFSNVVISQEFKSGKSIFWRKLSIKIA